MQVDFDPNELLERYMRHKLISEMGGKVLDRILPDSEDDRLRHQSMRTDIDYKRRMMGMPLNDDDYEKAVNDDFDFPQPATNLLGYFGRKVSDRLPSLRHFEHAGEAIPYILKGTGYGRRANAISRIFG